MTHKAKDIYSLACCRKSNRCSVVEGAVILNPGWVAEPHGSFQGSSLLNPTPKGNW